MVNSPKISGGKISIRDAIDFVSPLVDAGNELRAAKKRVRARIRYALQKGDLAFDKIADTRVFEAAAFFTWAKSKWPTLRNIEGLPAPTYTVSLKCGAITIAGVRAFVCSIPKDRKKLEQLYSSTASELDQAQHKIQQLESEVKLLRSELNEYRAKEEHTRAKRSAAGKRARGVPRR